MKFERLEDIAWQACVEGRKAPLTRRAGPGYADPAYALSVEWLATRQAIDPTQLAWGNPTTPSRVLLVCGSARNDGACPGEISKAGRLTELAERGRAFSVVVHGDVAGAEDHRRNLCDWLEWMDLIDAGAAAKLDRCIGFTSLTTTATTRWTRTPPYRKRRATWRARSCVPSRNGAPAVGVSPTSRPSPRSRSEAAAGVQPTLLE